MIDLLITLGTHAAALVIGWAARKYMVRRYPNEAALLDAVGSRYGKAAEQMLRNTAARDGG